MDISAMLSTEGATSPPTKSNGSNGNGLNSAPSSIVQSIKSTNTEEGEIDEEYKSSFQSNINIINDLDKNLELSNAIKILKFDEARLNSTMIHTNGISSNYIERVVAEDISTRNNKISDTNKNKDLHHLDSSKPLHHNTTRGREYKWGNSREINKIDPKPKRKKQVSTPAADDSSPQKVKRRSSIEDLSGTYGDYDAANRKLGNKAKAKRKTSPSPSDSLDSPPTSKRPKRKAAAVNTLSKDEDPEYMDAKLRTRSIKRELDEEGNAIKDDSKKPNTKEQKAVIKQYDNTYVAIWKDLSRKDGPKVSRLVQQSTQAKLINLKKTSILAAREAKRWQLKNNKGQKDLTTKARRAMREMFNFWKRNERIERELRKKHEKELIDKAKREEEEREAKRQSRKLNFLITQTELYSHFIGKKIKTDEIEGKDSDPNIKAKTNSSYDKYSNVDGSKKHDINSLDFDNDDDEFFNNAAAANAQNALEAAQSKAREFDGPNDLPENDEDKNGDEMNFQNPTLIGDLTITQPNLLKCTLKEYQIKGLNWLANLYEQGINGILADEMGLGKTVQSISVLSYLAEHHNIWGPFLVVTPASTLHNWQQEITKFVPDFKVLPYWGNGKDRKILRKFWDRKNVRYGKDAPFHVLVTSYQLVVADAAYFQKMKWQYMILDEAQAIKSSQSSRWKSLLSFSCRNRLLLTGTPIQNSMQELWALLHFIMPSLFDSHDEFSDWFSKDIESHAQSNTNLDEQQLRRLHMILKPFMLRRIKKNVQSELGDKVEIDIFCDLTNRQKKYYQMLKSQISIMDLLDSSSSNTGDDSTNLINLVMQFRKVCNHPDLFERADVKSSFSMAKFAETSSFLRESNDIEASYTSENLIKFDLPRLVYDELLTPSFSNDQLSKQSIFEKFSIYDPANTKDNEEFSWLKFVNSSSGELKKLTNTDVIERAIDRRDYNNEIYSGVSKFKYVYGENEENEKIASFVPKSKQLLIADYHNSIPNISNSNIIQSLYNVVDQVYDDMIINNLKPASEPNASAPPVTVNCSGSSYMNKTNDVLFNPKIRSSLVPLSLDSEYEMLQKNVPTSSYPPSNMLPQPLNSHFDYSNIRMPSMTRFITDAGKLAKLDQLLVELKRDDHRVLIYFQMTKMMDLMEEYLTFKQHTYIRLDGSSKLDDRRDLVHDWQSKPEIFIFLLSTRAGGLGINLTAADTVIFYDSDWNPTIDSQAMDRAHRLGQTRQVTVYRLLARGTIEERMRDRAKQKEQVQQVVMEGKGMIHKKDEAANKKKDVAFLLLGGDDTDKLLDSSVATTPGPDGEVKKNKGLNTKKLEEMYHEGEGKFSGTVTPSNG